MNLFGRNTAPCILLASLYIRQIYEEATIAAIPSDHAIENNEEFCKILQMADKYVEEENKDAIVTIGITPNRPETGYGYIKYEKSNDKVIKVERFVEKPDLETAKKYLADGNYLWNAGMFIFNVNNMLKELKQNYSGHEVLEKLPTINDTSYEETLNKIYSECESISIDYAVMEKSKNIYVIPGNFGWDDIGSWVSLLRYIKPDEMQNFIKGNVSSYDSKNNIVYAGDKKVILLNAEDIFCIDTDGVLVIGNRNSLAKIHELRSDFKELN